MIEQYRNLQKTTPGDDWVKRALDLTKSIPLQEGAISCAQGAFLLEELSDCKATVAVEIGVCSGYSSLFICDYLAVRKGKLFSFDLLDYYYGDPSKPVGYLVQERSREYIGVFNCFSRKFAAHARFEIEKVFGEGGRVVDVAFIDGSHRHPWATIDALLLAPLMRSGGKLILHDISLPVLTGKNEDYGPGNLFSQPFPQRAVEHGDWPNIGRITVADLNLVSSLALKSLRLPWEISLPDEMRNLVSRELELYVERGTYDRAFVTEVIEMLRRG
jgi:hypothetical protein